MVYIKSYPATKTELHKNSEAISRQAKNMYQESEKMKDQ
jgi:hypothetical protein